MDANDKVQINIVVNARKTISVAIASVHVIVEKDARTEILNFVTDINSLMKYFYSSEIMLYVDSLEILGNLWITRFEADEVITTSNCGSIDAKYR